VLEFAGAAFAAPGWVCAQTRKIYRLGWLNITEDEASMTRLLENVCLPPLRDLGYERGRNFEVYVRFSLAKQAACLDSPKS